MPWTHRAFWLGPLLIAAILSALWAIVHSTWLQDTYKRKFCNTIRRERLFLASLGFFVAVAVIRGITIAIHNEVGPFHNISMRGRHIHHLVWGILLLLFIGYSWLIEVGTGVNGSLGVSGRLTSVLYGVAAALTLDEFALWLNLSDVYWQRQGRESYEALGISEGCLLSESSAALSSRVSSKSCPSPSAENPPITWPDLAILKNGPPQTIG